MMRYSDDPIADFLHHDAEQNRKLNLLPRCSYCDKRIQDDYLYDLDGDIYCEKCMNKQFRRQVDDYVE